MEKTTKSKYYLFIDECGDHNLAKYDPGVYFVRYSCVPAKPQYLNILKHPKIKKSGLSTALSDRAKPIPKIVACASEVFS